MIQPQSLVESQTTSDKSHMITKRTIQSIRWDEFRCERCCRSFNYVCTSWYNISLKILLFTPVQRNYFLFHSSLNVDISAKSSKLIRTSSRDISNELVMFLYDSRKKIGLYVERICYLSETIHYKSRWIWTFWIRFKHPTWAFV